MNKQTKISTIASIGILGGVCVFLTFSSFGFIAIGPITLTTMHIPVVIAAIIGGPVIGGAVGLIFGVSSMINALLRPSPLSIAFLNPLIAILPRVLFGVVTGLLYQLIQTKHKQIALYLSCSIGTLFHSLAVLSGLFLFYQSFFGSNTTLAFQSMVVIFFTNSVPEILMALFVVPPIIYAYTRKTR